MGERKASPLAKSENTEGTVFRGLSAPRPFHDVLSYRISPLFLGGSVEYVRPTARDRPSINDENSPYSQWLDRSDRACDTDGVVQQQFERSTEAGSAAGALTRNAIRRMSRAAGQAHRCLFCRQGSLLVPLDSLGGGHGDERKSVFDRMVDSVGRRRNLRSCFPQNAARVSSR